MKILQQNDASSIPACMEALLNHEVIAIPTETVYGLVALWNSDAARQEIYRLKHRPADKRLQMLAPDLETAEKAGLVLTPQLRRIAARFWPGALTVIAETALQDTIGLRIPNHPFVLQLLKALKQPIAATSANLSGRPAAIEPQDATKDLDGQPSILIDGGCVTITDGASSTVVSIVGGTLKLLREGPVSLQELQKTIGMP